MEAPSKKRIFITGITGFTGKHFEKHLSEIGYDVYGSTLRDSLLVNHYKCDLKDENSVFNVLKVVRPDYIIHLAAISFVANENQREIYDVNIFGTINLLKAIAKLDFTPLKILIASSASVYGNIEGELNEEMCPQPVNHYGNSKLVMENMVKQYYDHQNIVIVRPFNYTGIGQEAQFLVPKIVSHFKNNKKTIELGNINVQREFNSIQFVIGCYTDLLLSSVKSDIFNVCTGESYTIKDILNLLEEIAGFKIKININSKFIRENEIKVLKGSPVKLFNVLNDNTLRDIGSLRNNLESMYNQVGYLDK